MLTKILPFAVKTHRFAKPSTWKITCRFSSTTDNSSYIHKLGTQSLKHLTVGQMLSQSAEKFSDRESLISCNENLRLTFSETLDKADRLASGLLNLGLTKGDRVAIWAPNFEFWFISLFAISRAGLICVAMNPAYQLPELDYCIKKVDVKAIIAPESFRKQKHFEMLTELKSNQKRNEKFSLQHVIIKSDKNLPGTINFDDLIKSSSENDVGQIAQIQSSISPDLGCNIQFSSGTTGQPKAALLSHFSLVNNSHDIGIRQELHKTYRKICLNNPFFHAYGIVIAILNAVTHGSTLVVPSPHFRPEDSLITIAREKCDVIFGTPTMFVDLVAKQNELNVELPQLDLAITGGAIFSPKLAKDVENVLKVKKVQSVYGLTESTACVFQSLPNDANETVQEFVGHVGDNVEVKVIDSNGNTVPFGQPGELCLRGYLTMLGYWNDDEKTRETLVDNNWLKTGDQFILNANGYGKVVGRLKEMIIRGGENLFPREIEDFLNTHPNILETHVIGIPDERMGEEVGAFIRLKDNTKELTHDEVKNFCKGKLSHFKVPRYVIVVREFPKTASGKIQKFKFMENFKREFENATSKS